MLEDRPGSQSALGEPRSEFEHENSQQRAVLMSILKFSLKGKGALFVASHNLNRTLEHSHIHEAYLWPHGA